MSPRANPSLTEETDVVFEATGVTKVYDMGEVKVHALRGVDLRLYTSEFLVLLGPSGSGKSTLLNILGGLDLPTAGRVSYRGRDLSGADDAARTEYRRLHVGFVFQFYNLIPSLTAKENVALVTEISRDPLPPGDALEIVRSRRPLEPLPFPAIRWRAAARCDCQGHREATGRAALRRADGSLGHHDRDRGAGGDRENQSGTRHVDRGDHAQRARWQTSRTG